MLLVYHGTDIQRRRQAIQSIKKQLKEKRPEAEMFSLDHDQFNRSQLTELVSSRGLFEDKYVAFLYHVLSIEEGKEAIAEHVEPMADSEHVFVLIEDQLEDDHKDLLTTHAREIKHVGGQAKGGSEQQPWDLTDAYGRRDRSDGWIELHKALQNPDSRPESLHGALWWQTKMMWLAKHTDSASEADVSGYPYKKASQFEKNFTEDELFAKTKRLISMRHEAHRGKHDLENALEQFILEV